MSKILITASGGFLGSNLIRLMLKPSPNKPIEDHNIVGIDNCSYPNVLNTLYSNKGHKFYIADVKDLHIMDVIFSLEKPDIVLHSDVGGTVGMHNIMSSCIKYNVKHLMYLSDYGVYGSLKTDQDRIWTETSSYKSEYEDILKTPVLKHTIVRLCDNIGPRQYNGFVPSVIRGIMGIGPKALPYDGKAIRSYLHIQDTCLALMKILENPANNEIYNISARQEFSYIEVLQQVCNAAQSGYDVIKLIPGENKQFRLSTENAKIKQIGWSSTWKFRDAIAATTKWYIDNPWFLKG